MRTYIEVDIYEDYIQDQRIAIPDKEGMYTLVPDLVIEGKMWFDLNVGVQVMVKAKSDTLKHNKGL